MAHSTSIAEGDKIDSPGLGAGAGLGPAFELKYLLGREDVPRVEAWARRHLTPDPHGQDGVYRVTSVYCDTPGLDVFYRQPGFRRSKYRLRRYGVNDQVFLERKQKRGDKVRKKRVLVHGGELSFLEGAGHPEAWQGAWFAERLRQRELRPTCRVAYWRTAFHGRAELPIRLTFDRDLVGSAADCWQLSPLQDGEPLLSDGVLVELKFHLHMPALFQELLPLLPAEPARLSKYRRCVELCGIDRVRPASRHEANGKIA